MRVVVASAGMLLAGCAQLLGLDKTSLEQPDGNLDAASVCDGAPLCTAGTTGRSVCGQLFETGANAGQPFRIAEPTGAACGVSVDGPCALQVAGNTMEAFFNNDATADVPGQIDDCGRFAVPDLDPLVPVAVKFTDPANTFRISATLVVLGRPAEPGAEDRDVPAYAVLATTVADWSTSLDAMTPPDLSSAYLVKYTSSDGLALAGEAVAVDNGSALVNPPGTIPWAGYFAGSVPFGTLDTAATVTAASGTAITVMPAGPFSLEGFRQGRRCKIENLRSVSNTLIHVVEEDC